MKSNKFLCVLVFVLSHFVMSAQSDLEVIYKKRTTPQFFEVPDSLSHQKSNILKRKNLFHRNIGHFKHSLKIDVQSGLSVFEDVKRMDVAGDERFNNQMKSVLASRFPIYNNLEKDSLYEDVNYRGMRYMIRFKSPRYKWTLKSDNKQILGFKCYLAVAEYVEKDVIFDFEKEKKRVFYAWYAPSLPSKFLSFIFYRFTRFSFTGK